MRSLVIGSIVAAVAMFLIGFAFYGTPMMTLGWSEASPEVQAALQSALKALPHTGTYAIPSDQTPEAAAAFAAGPVATIRYNSSGFAMMDPAVFAEGFIHMALSAFLLGLALWTVRDRVADFGARLRLVLMLSLAMAVFTRLGDPIWYHSDWRNAVYVGIADFITFAVAGAILARWFVRGARTA